MNKFTDPTTFIPLVLMFAVGLIVGQQNESRENKKHYIVDASEVEVVYSNPYKALTLDTCVTDYECNIAQLLDDQANGRVASTDSIPVIEPIDCEPKDKECLKQNANAGKPAQYPSICEAYISDKKEPLNLTEK